MDRSALQNLFVQVLRCALNDTELDDTQKGLLTTDVLSALYALAKHHALAHILAAVLNKSGVPLESALQEQLTRAEILAAYRQEQRENAFRQICSVLNERQIPYIPLKGAVIAPYYPRSAMRTSCDIDILIHEEDLPAAIAGLSTIGFSHDKVRGYHDVSLYSPAKIHLELHFSIQENVPALDRVLKLAWQYATPVEGSRHAFRDDFFLFYMYAHMCYHFLAGGCGFRPLMDLWVIEHRMHIAPSVATPLLEKAGICRFSTEVNHLVNVCFSGAEKDAFSDALLAYIVSGGVYGSVKNRIGVSKARKNSTLSFALKRIFFPYRSMALEYPLLRRLPFLLPVFWVVRFFRMLTQGRAGSSLAELRAARDLTPQEAERVKRMLDHLGL